MAKKFKYKQLIPAQLGIQTTGIVFIPIQKFRIRLDDGRIVEVLPPAGKSQFDDGDEIDLDAIPGAAGKNKRCERQLKKDPRFVSQP